jgi:Lon protease-like protein
MFPLGTVLFPYAVLPLHVFEPRYRALTRHVLDGDQEFGIALIERGSEVGGGDVRFGVGTLAHVVQFAQLADGRFALAVVGVSRFRVERWLPEEPFPRAEIVALPELDGEGDVGTLLADALDALRAVFAIASQIEGATDVPEPSVSPDPEQAAYEIAALASPGPLDAQRLLELPDTAARLSALRAHLDETAAVLRARLGDA